MPVPNHPDIPDPRPNNDPSLQALDSFLNTPPPALPWLHLEVSLTGPVDSLSLLSPLQSTLFTSTELILTPPVWDWSF